jgi:hypothetical protein
MSYIVETTKKLCGQASSHGWLTIYVVPFLPRDLGTLETTAHPYYDEEEARGWLKEHLKEREKPLAQKRYEAIVKWKLRKTLNVAPGIKFGQLCLLKSTFLDTQKEITEKVRVLWKEGDRIEYAQGTSHYTGLMRGEKFFRELVKIK